jgi:hypothetical protein
MANKKNVQAMTPEELAAYVEAVRKRNAANSKKYYDTKIKTDPEKYKNFLIKCKEPNRKYYYKKQMLQNADPEWIDGPNELVQEGLAQYL